MEMGKDSIIFHEEIGDYAKTHNIEKLLTLGKLSRHVSIRFGENATHFNDINSLKNNLKNIPSKANILVKGSRSMRMERIVKFLTDTSEGEY